MRVAALLALVFAAAAARGPGLTIMSYNVENLFDDVRDGTEYPEFNPERGRWGATLFQERIRLLSDVLRRAVPGAPDVVLLQEVENEHTVQVLLDRGLRGLGYAWHSLDPKRGLAATIAILSRVPIVRVRTHAVGPWAGSTPVRDILEAELQVDGRTLYVLNNHWKSKTEGVSVTEPCRREAAAALCRRISEILTAAPSADIVAGGDFNESVDEFSRSGARRVTALMPAQTGRPLPRGDPVLFLTASLPAASAGGGPCVLFEPWLEVESEPRGSFSWKGEWITPDHLLLSPGLFDRVGFRYRPRSFLVVHPPFLLTSRGLPRRWDSRSGSGYSDHLPILLTLDLN